MRDGEPWKGVPWAAPGAVVVLLMVACGSADPPPALGGGAVRGADDGGGGGGEDAATDDASAAGDSPSDATSASGWGPAECPATPAGVSVGYATGDQLSKVVVKDCNGNDVSLDRFCGASALWIFVAWGWCPHCQLASSESESIMAAYAGKNVAAVNVLVQNAQYEKPTAADCQAWAKTYHLGTNVVPLYDPSGAALALQDNQYTALSVFVAKDRVITAKEHTDDKATIERDLDAALAH